MSERLDVGLAEERIDAERTIADDADEFVAGQQWLDHELQRIAEETRQRPLKKARVCRAYGCLNLHRNERPFCDVHAHLADRETAVALKGRGKKPVYKAPAQERLSMKRIWSDGQTRTTNPDTKDAAQREEAKRQAKARQTPHVNGNALWWLDRMHQGDALAREVIFDNVFRMAHAAVKSRDAETADLAVSIVLDELLADRDPEGNPIAPGIFAKFDPTRAELSTFIHMKASQAAHELLNDAKQIPTADDFATSSDGEEYGRQEVDDEGRQRVIVPGQRYGTIETAAPADPLNLALEQDRLREQAEQLAAVRAVLTDREIETLAACGSEEEGADAGTAELAKRYGLSDSRIRSIRSEARAKARQAIEEGGQ